MFSSRQTEYFSMFLKERCREWKSIKLHQVMWRCLAVEVAQCVANSTECSAEEISGVSNRFATSPGGGSLNNAAIYVCTAIALHIARKQCNVWTMDIDLEAQAWFWIKAPKILHCVRHIGTLHWHMLALRSVEVDINNMQSREGGQKKGPDESKTVSEFLFLCIFTRFLSV